MSNTGESGQQTIIVPATNTTTGVPSQYVVPGNTGSGFIVGVDPGARPAPMTQQPQPNGPTAEEIAAAVGSQVNPRIEQQGTTIEQMQSQMAAMQAEIDAARQEREAAQAERDAAEQARLAAEQQAREQEMSATELVAQVRAEFQQRFDQQQAETAAANAILDQERHFNALNEYKANRLADPEISRAVMPHLHQYIVGNSEQEIEEAIARAAATSDQIVGEFQNYQQQYRQAMPGVSPAAPTTGPLEAAQAQTTMTAEQIAALTPAEYARLRPQLLRAAGDAHRAQGR